MTLITDGADVDATNQDGLTAVMLAAQRGHAEVNSPSPWSNQPLRSIFQVVAALIGAGANVDAAVEATGQTALHMVASQPSGAITVSRRRYQSRLSS